MSFFLITFSTLLAVLFGFLRYKYSYWELRGVKQLKTHFLLGNFSQTRTFHLGDLCQAVYDDFKGKANLVGAYVFLKPVAVILDLDLIKAILIKDFSNFVDRADPQDYQKDPLTNNLFATNAAKWRILRPKLTPTFTSGKIKLMFSTVADVAQRFQDALEKDLEQRTDKVLEIYDFMGRFTTDVIGSCAFGIECNSLLDPDNEFRRIGRRTISRRKGSPRMLLFRRTYVNYLKYFGSRRYSSEALDFMLRVVTETVALREREHIKRNDFMNLLIELKNSEDAKGVPFWTLLQMVAQAFIFFVAGFETSSSNLTFGLYELAKHTEIQEKVRREIMDVLTKYEGIVSYEAMMEMTYLDQVITETIRKYPALPHLSRYASEDYKVPDSDIVLEKGIKVLIPVMAIHYDPDIYDNPQEFRPERFSAEETQKRHPQSFLGFGDGPRNCIGLRFARMQVRIGLITLLKSFRFSVCDKTSKNLKLGENNTILTPGENVWLKVEKI